MSSTSMSGLNEKNISLLPSLPHSSPLGTASGSLTVTLERYIRSWALNPIKFRTLADHRAILYGLVTTAQNVFAFFTITPSFFIRLTCLIACFGAIFGAIYLGHLIVFLLTRFFRLGDALADALLRQIQLINDQLVKNQNIKEEGIKTGRYTAADLGLPENGWTYGATQPLGLMKLREDLVLGPEGISVNLGEVGVQVERACEMVRAGKGRIGRYEVDGRWVVWL